MPPMPFMNPAVAVSEWLAVVQSERFRGDTPERPPAGARSHSITTRSGSRNGSGRRSAASTSAKMAAFAPMPRASVMTATSVKVGAAFICRSAKTTSCLNSSIHIMRRRSRSR